MATKPEVQTSIATIVDNGSNKATVVRKVMNDMLDFSDAGITACNTSITQIDNRVKVLENDKTLSNRVTGVEKDVKDINLRIDKLNFPETFQFVGTGTFPSTDPSVPTGSIKLGYSFRGIVNLSVNFTFRMEVLAAGVGFSFAPKLDDLNKLLAIYPTDPNFMESFVVPVNTLRQGTAGSDANFMRMSVRISTKGVFLEFIGTDNVKLKKGDTIYTSVHFHAPTKFE